MFSYRADAFAAGYSLGDAVEALSAYLRMDRLLDLETLIVVCHSMGGILVRQFLVARESALGKHMRIGLFLVASPSLGSGYANLLKIIAKAFGHSQALALQFAANNAWLNDLDRNFINLKESRRLFIEGRELVEDELIAFPTFFRRQVVPPFSGARYFGESIKIPRSDHFTIAKPKDRNALQHRLLVDFISNLLPRRESINELALRARMPRLLLRKLTDAALACICLKECSGRNSIYELMRAKCARPLNRPNVATHVSLDLMWLIAGVS